MRLGNNNGRGKLFTPIDAPSRQASILVRQPYAATVLAVTIAVLCVIVSKWLAGFPPLILLGATPAICFVVLGFRAGFLAVLLSALASDFFFVEPVLTFTRHSFLLAAYYSVAALVPFYIKSKAVNR